MLLCTLWTKLLRTLYTLYRVLHVRSSEMGLGWMWWRALLAGLVATAATLLHFHRECGARRDAELAARAARRYRPELGTNCQDTKLCFVSADSEASFGESAM